MAEPAYAVTTYWSRYYVGDHGDGVLNANGTENEPWQIGSTKGSGCRGGWYNGAGGCTTSYRQLAVRWTVYTGIGSRVARNGGRSVRTAP